MLRDDSQDVRDAAPSICLVVPVASGKFDSNDAVGRSIRVMRALRKRGWSVHALAASVSDDARREATVVRKCRQVGATATSLARLRLPSTVRLSGPNQPAFLQASERVRHALSVLHRRYHFDLIQVTDRGGFGFRTIQAKRVGLDFRDVRLAINVSGPTALLRRSRQRWCEGPDDLALDYCERFAFDHADLQLIALGPERRELESVHWIERGDARALPNGASDQEVADCYDGLWNREPASRRDDTSIPSPLVSVGIAHYNLGSYLSEALESLARQTYANVDVTIIDDGSTDPSSLSAFRSLRDKYGQFRFVEQENQGIGATRNRALRMSKGEYFLPMDADNLAHPDMIAALVRAMTHRPGAAAMTCYFLAFEDEDRNAAASSLSYAYRPIGGPRVLAALWNVYGDANALFRVDALRDVGGFATDRDTSWEDWEVFVKLASAGLSVEVVPEHLFYYRHRASGFSRATETYRNHQRVLRHFVQMDGLPLAEREMHWNLIVGMHRRVESMAGRLASRRHRLADWMHGVIRRARALLSSL